MLISSSEMSFHVNYSPLKSAAVLCRPYYIRVPVTKALRVGLTLLSLESMGFLPARLRLTQNTF